MSAPIPVYLSRYGDLPKPYGAFIKWEVGERVLGGGNGTVVTIVDPELKWHDGAPEIDSARGVGLWVIEVVFDGEVNPSAVSPKGLVMA